MKRTELTPGTTYAYRAGKYGSFAKVRVIDTEAVYRIAGGYYGNPATDNRDGIRVVVEDGYVHSSSISQVQWERAKENPNTYSSKRIFDLYDENTSNDEDVVRVLPRYIVRTWAEHLVLEQEEEDRWKANAIAKEETAVIRLAQYKQLPEGFKEFIDLGPNGFHIAAHDVDGLVKLILVEGALAKLREGLNGTE